MVTAWDNWFPRGFAEDSLSIPVLSSDFGIFIDNLYSWYIYIIQEQDSSRSSRILHNYGHGREVEQTILTLSIEIPIEVEERSKAAWFLVATVAWLGWDMGKYSQRRVVPVDRLVCRNAGISYYLSSNMYYLPN